MRQGLLLHKGKLIIPDVDHLRIKLIHEAHTTHTTVHPGTAKTHKLLVDWYYWIGITSDVNRYVDNC